jgi:hypothetical protein
MQNKDIKEAYQKKKKRKRKKKVSNFKIIRETQTKAMRHKNGKSSQSKELARMWGGHLACQDTMEPHMTISRISRVAKRTLTG